MAPILDWSILFPSLLNGLNTITTIVEVIYNNISNVQQTTVVENYKHGIGFSYKASWGSLDVLM